VSYALRVSRLSEIASADGKSLHRDSLFGMDSAIHLSATKWPRQARPLKVDWKFWRKSSVSFSPQPALPTFFALIWWSEGRPSM
jgi:hypothetical protein